MLTGSRDQPFSDLWSAPGAPGTRLPRDSWDVGPKVDRGWKPTQMSPEVSVTLHKTKEGEGKVEEVRLVNVVCVRVP